MNSAKKTKYLDAIQLDVNDENIGVQENEANYTDWPCQSP